MSVEHSAEVSDLELAIAVADLHAKGYKECASSVLPLMPGEYRIDPRPSEYGFDQIVNHKGEKKWNLVAQVKEDPSDVTSALPFLFRTQI